MGVVKDKSYVDIYGEIDPKTGHRVARPRLTSTENKRDKRVYTKLSLIPVIFVPGIMGTNLKLTGRGDAVWRPPNGLVRGMLSAAVWMWRGPKTRQQRLNPATVVVDPDGPIDVGGCGITKALAKERGWGTVMRDPYHPIMALLQRRLNVMARFNTGKGMPELYADWSTDAMNTPGDYGEQRGIAALTKDEIIQAARHLYDVWCCGYNWLQSNRESGGALKTYIESTVLKHYAENKIAVDKVILVTHSMGGLVSRALTEIHNYKVLGVVCGVEPATGAPAIYHHARCGYQGPEQVVLGRNAGEVTAVIANAPGALELVPSFDHSNGRPWLFVDDYQSQNTQPPLPVKANPYAEIYINPAWYGLVPASNTQYLNLSGDTIKATARAHFGKLIAQVEKFHHDIAKKYHKQTFAFYGADSRQHSWQTIHWQGRIQALTDPAVKDDGNGNYSKPEFMGRTYTPVAQVSMAAGANSAGDGTVSATSGAAPGAADAKASFCHGNQGKGSHNRAEGYEHQDSYLDARAQWATFYSIVKIAQGAVE